MILHAYDLKDDLATHTLHHQSHSCPDADACTEASMQRFVDNSTTVYEIKIPIRGLGADTLTNSMAMVFGMCLNDGDTEAGQDSQKGWSGWGPVLDCVRQELAGVRSDHHDRRFIVPLMAKRWAGSVLQL